ncbi:hypothetical protein GMDG_06057 [Pseudogymnoascus destructans 20631-21]|uniref:Uncharacterized protein n=1 Tax=Pseudogymnoascus destructans (strain ATCC MYA-4855 / 20631-21) TaxID=658429 RepID=L8FRW3_PSED2|nr:hypothetical protein GMDG_06057 [Pseudogymnoascus destructans 20631-21]
MYDEDRLKTRGAMSQYRAQFGMLYNKENGRLMDSNDRKEVLKFIDTLGLDRTVKSKPVFNERQEGILTVEGDARLFDALCYEDVRLLVVHSPNNSERDVLAMEVKLSHHKGHNKHPKLTIFFFTESTTRFSVPSLTSYPLHSQMTHSRRRA